MTGLTFEHTDSHRSVICIQFIMQFYTGTSGLVVPFVQNDYPPAFQGKGRLHFYSSFFNSIEINSSFYKNTAAATVARWAAMVNEDFRFTFKMPKAISHAKDLKYTPGDIDMFMQVVNAAGNKKGCLLLQLPPKLKIDSFNEVHALLEQVRENDPGESWNVAVEFRDASWYIGEVDEMLAEFNACMVMHDLPKCPAPLQVKGDYFYLRFHGGGRYRGSYSQKVLEKYAGLVKEWMQEGKSGYCYFNNTMGDAFANAASFRQMTGQ